MFVPCLARFGRLAASVLLALSLAGTAHATQSSAEAAIQDVIQRGNAAQAVALATGDSTGLAATAADAYYRALLQTNQGLLDSGVIGIEMVDLEWGPISVGGDAATATTFETWRTSYSSGPTDFSRDRNVYSLVQDADGAWRVASDDHPDGADRRTATPSPSAPSPPVPQQEPGASTSRNWSGYAARDGTFTSVSATWTVPHLALDGPFGADAAWVGIGGVRSDDLIQAGTQHSASGNESASYEAWIEMLPDVSHPVPLTVLPGDTMTVSVDQQTRNTWLISFTNQTSGQLLQRSVQYASSVSSAEWIEEAPSGRRRVLPISQFGSLSFSTASAVKDGESLTPTELSANAISLVDADGHALAVPSPLSDDGASFTVSRR